MNTLNSKYFKTLSTRVNGDTEYVMIKPLDSPMVLFSKIDGTPLAALHLRCQENTHQNKFKNNLGKALITKRPFKSKFQCDFQGIINKDDQEFELVISNLCSEGHINFNIFKTNSKTLTVNPGGLNQINELRPYESYAVQCDQTDNKVLILSSIKKEDNPDIKLTVGEAEKKTTDKQPEGTYYFLSVVPVTGKEVMSKRFKETMWTTVDYFILTRKATVYQPSGPTGWSGRREWSSRQDESFRASDIRTSVPEAGFRNVSYRNTGVREQRDGRRGPARIMKMKIGSKHSSNELASSKPTSKHVRPEEDDCDESFDLGLDTSVDFIGYVQDSISIDEVVEKSDNLQLQSKSMSKGIQAHIINDSFATKVTGGRQIQVNSVETGLEYDYESQSVPCVLCLSISEAIIFKAEPTNYDNELINMCKQAIEDMIQNANKQLLSKLVAVYPEENCVICYEGINDGKPVDSIFYQCGHQCCHNSCSANLDKCPLCRNRITANIYVETNMNEVVVMI